jgi:hypothetical protein
MIHITLSSEEAVILREIIEAYLSDLRMEIADTDRMDFRDELKKKEIFLKDMLKILPD